MKVTVQARGRGAIGCWRKRGLVAAVVLIGPLSVDWRAGDMVLDRRVSASR